MLFLKRYTDFVSEIVSCHNVIIVRGKGGELLTGDTSEIASRSGRYNKLDEPDRTS